MAKRKREPETAPVLATPARAKYIEELRSEVLRTALESQGAEAEVERLKAPLRAASDLARWAKTIHYAAVLELRRALEGER